MEWSGAQGEGQSLKGVVCGGYYKAASLKTLPTDQSLQMSQVTSALHLAQVGCGSLNKGDINAPHLRPPTPGQSRWSHDIDIT